MVPDLVETSIEPSVPLSYPQVADPVREVMRVAGFTPWGTVIRTVPDTEWATSSGCSPAAMIMRPDTALTSAREVWPISIRPETLEASTAPASPMTTVPLLSRERHKPRTAHAVATVHRHLPASRPYVDLRTVLNVDRTRRRGHGNRSQPTDAFDPTGSDADDDVGARRHRDRDRFRSGGDFEFAVDLAQFAIVDRHFCALDGADGHASASGGDQHSTVLHSC